MSDHHTAGIILNRIHQKGVVKTGLIRAFSV